QVNLGAINDSNWRLTCNRLSSWLMSEVATLLSGRTLPESCSWERRTEEQTLLSGGRHWANSQNLPFLGGSELIFSIFSRRSPQSWPTSVPSLWNVQYHCISSP